MPKAHTADQSPSKGTLSLIAAVVVAVYLVVTVGVGRMFRNSWTPEFIDGWFGLSDHVIKVVSTRLVDAGYSAAFTFGSDDHLPRSLLFSSEGGQRPVVTLRMYAVPLAGSSPGSALVDPTIDVRVDGSPVSLPEGGYPIRITKLAIDKKLSSEVEDNTHEISFNPKSVPRGTEVTVQCLVLVYQH
jgi:hypothetical protein